MKSIIKYLIYFLAVILIVWWLVSTFRGNSSTEATMEESSSMTDMSDVSEDDISLDDILEDSDAEQAAQNEGENTVSTEEQATPSATSEEMDNDDASDDIMIEETPPASHSEEHLSKGSSHASSSGKYMVIVGSFIVPANAQNMKKKLERMGYDGAEVVNFDLSEYHTVLAGRYASLSAANQTVRALKSKGMDAYAQRKKQ